MQLPRLREVGAFTVIGTTATAINITTVAVAVPSGLPALNANIIGFLLSFVWCFFGHSRWTFPAERRDALVALRRFAVVSVLGFTLTETAYAGALHWTTIDYRVSLFLIMLTLGGVKLLASKNWAFARG